MARPRSDPTGDQCRCACGSLLARLRADGIELKCRRCKRIMLVPWSDVENGDAAAGRRLAVPG